MTDAAFASFASRLGLSTHFRRGTRGDPVPVDGDEQTVMVANPVSLMYAHGKSMGRGTLTITTRRVVWCSASQPSSALALRYQQIVAHAVSRTDPLVHQRPCIYLQMDDGEADRPATADTEVEPVELEPEIRLVPEDISKLDDMYKALRDCASLRHEVPSDDGSRPPSRVPSRAKRQPPTAATKAVN